MRWPNVLYSPTVTTMRPIVAATSAIVAIAKTHVAIKTRRAACRSASIRFSAIQTSSTLAAPQVTFGPPMRRRMASTRVMSSSVMPSMRARSAAPSLIAMAARYVTPDARTGLPEVTR
jgi:hypothetical protein